MIELIVNPIAGNGRARKALALVERELVARQIGFHTSETTAPGHATALTRRAIEGGAESVAVLGGDGLLSEVCAAIADSSARLLFVPCGTGNDFIKSLKLPRSPLKALRLQLDNPQRRIDCGALNGVPFLNVAGVGLDTDVLVQTGRYRWLPTGMLPYILGVLKTLSAFRPLEAEVCIDGVTEHRRYTIISIANGRYIGGGMKAAPLAELGDGLLDVMLVEALPSWRLWLLMPLFLPGWHAKLTVTRRVTARDVTIKCGGAFTVEVDGELKQVSMARFQVKPQSVTISCPV